MSKIISFFSRHAIFVIIVILAITGFFGYKALSLQLDANYASFMPWGNGEDSYEGGISFHEPAEDTVTLKEIRGSSEAQVKLKEAAAKASGAKEIERPLKIDDSQIEYVNQSDPNDKNSSFWSNLLVMIEGDDIFTKDNLNLIQMTVERLTSRSDIGLSSSVYDFVTLEKRGTRLATVPMNPNNDGDGWTEEEAALFASHIENDPIIKYYLVGGSGNSILFDFRSKDFNNQSYAEVLEILQPLKDRGLNVYTNGNSVINLKVMNYLQKDLITLVSLCFVMIQIVFFFCFRSKRSVLIPMSLSVIALVWTFGTMAMMGLKLTILNIVTPCMVLTLGSAYAIHVLSEYYASHQKDPDIDPSFAVSKIFRTILFACLTTVCGFLCLSISKTEGLVEFGLAVSIGIAYCALLSCVYLPAILSLVSKPKSKQLKSYEFGLMAKLVKALSSFVPANWKNLIVAFFILIALFFVVKDRISVDANYMSYFPDSDPFGAESRRLAEEMGGTTPFEIKIKADPSAKNFFLESENLKKVLAFENALLESPDTLQVISFPQYISFANRTVSGEGGIPENKGLMNMISRLVIALQKQTGLSLSSIINEDATEISLIVQNWDSLERDLQTVSSSKRMYALIMDSIDLLPEGTTITIGGYPVVAMKFSNALLSDQNKSTVLSILVVLVLCVFSFKSLTKGILVLVPVLSGIMINYLFMFIAGIPFDMITVSFTSIAIGCGVDDAIHFLLRLKSKLKNGDAEPSLLVRDVIIETGRPIILTTLSIVAGMIMLGFASYTPIRYFGLLMSVSLMGCMVSTLLFLPPFVILFDKIGKKVGFKNRGNRNAQVV